MDEYKRLAEVIRKFDNTEWLATSIENITEEQDKDIVSMSDLAEFLENELSYAYE